MLFSLFGLMYTVTTIVRSDTKTYRNKGIVLFASQFNKIISPTGYNPTNPLVDIKPKGTGFTLMFRGSMNNYKVTPGLSSDATFTINVFYTGKGISTQVKLEFLGGILIEKPQIAESIKKGGPVTTITLPMIATGQGLNPV